MSIKLYVKTLELNHANKLWTTYDYNNNVVCVEGYHNLFNIYNTLFTNYVLNANNTKHADAEQTMNTYVLIKYFRLIIIIIIIVAEDVVMMVLPCWAKWAKVYGPNDVHEEWAHVKKMRLHVRKKFYRPHVLMITTILHEDNKYFIFIWNYCSCIIVSMPRAR